MSGLKIIHLKQLAIIIAVAAVGLGSGLVVGAKGAASEPPVPIADKVVSLPHSLPSTSPSPIVVALTPSPSPKVTPKQVVKQAAPVSKKRSDFNWGVTVMPFPLRDTNEKLMPEQMRLAKELGLSVVRVEYAVNNAAMNNMAVEEAKKQGLKLVFIIPFGPNDIFSDKNLYENTHKYVADIVGQYKGQVPVWQLATEVASVALVSSGHHGVDRVDYPEAKYQAVSTWLKAASRAVKESDPSAKRLINDQWVHVGFFDRFIAEGGDFDILGWNWFSDMGTNMSRAVLDAKKGQTYDLLGKLKKYNKEIWLTEINRRLGSNGGKEKEQADYIQTMAESAYKEPVIKGFFVFNLIEDQTAKPQEQGYGIMHVDPATNWVAGPKQAYGRYQALIRAKQ